MQSPLALGLFLFSFMLFGVVHVANADVPSPLPTDSIDAQAMFFETTALDVFNVVEEPNMIYKCRGCAAPDTVYVGPTQNRDDSDTLYGAVFVETVQIGGSHYALVGFYYDRDIQIINVTDPASPVETAYVTERDEGFTELGAVNSIATAQIGGSHYALVASKPDGGLQMIDITDPASPRVTASISDGKDGFTELGGATSITTTQIKDGHYALVARYLIDGVQIIDITDPASPRAVASVTDGNNGFAELFKATSITTTQIGGSHYALVASLADDGIQIIDITNPINPLLPLTASATDPAEGTVAATIRMWSGFEPGSVTDAQLLDALNLGHGREIPDWMMTHLGVLFSEDRITLEEFTTALSYVLEKT